jgi:hypothetical protein
MQAAKIKIGATYAIREGDNLRMFKVRSVVTTRTGPHPSDFSHRVRGVVEGEESEERVVSNDAVLGPYEEYAELVEKRAREKAEAKRRDDEIADRAHRLMELFCRMIGEPMPGKTTDWNAMIREGLSGTVEINREGVEKLLAALMEKADV